MNPHPEQEDAVRMAIANDDFIKQIICLKAEVAELKNKKFVRFNNEECWIYQGDGDDHLESLVCPVVISADKLLDMQAAITSERAKAEKLVSALEKVTAQLRILVPEVGMVNDERMALMASDEALADWRKGSV